MADHNYSEVAKIAAEEILPSDDSDGLPSLPSILSSTEFLFYIRNCYLLSLVCKYNTVLALMNLCVISPGLDGREHYTSRPALTTYLL
jgi:hypothetical protein